MKLITVVGARPQFVKAAPMSRLLRQSHAELLVHTGQHYDDEMSGSFFRDLELPEPDLNLGVGSGTHAFQTAEILRRLAPVIAEHEPDGVLVYGDTNSTLAAAVVTSKISYSAGRRPWLAHVEAGLRSFNPGMPEERNRVVADHLADLALAPTAAAMANLEREGLGDRAKLVGDVMVDAFAWASDRCSAHLPVIAREPGGYLLATIHRAENVDDPDRLGKLIRMLDLDRRVLFPVHPRTRAAIADGPLRLPANVHAIDPVGHLAMVALERGADAVLTDSGGVQKEAYLAGVPCLTLRSETEWVETVDSGWNRVVGTDGTALRDALADAGFMARQRSRPAIFGDGQAASRVVSALEELNASWPAAAAPASAGWSAR